MLTHETFYVVRQDASAPVNTVVTVLNQVPMGAHELCSFGDPNEAIEFAQTAALELRSNGLAAEYVDPPYTLVGAG